MILNLVIIVLSTLVLIFIYLFFRKGQTLKQFEIELEDFKNKYKGIIDVDKVIDSRKIELNSINQNISNLSTDFSNQKEKLNQDFKIKRDIYENLLKEVSILEENLENISFGLYKPHYDYKTSDEFKQKLDLIRETQKGIIKREEATIIPDRFTYNDSLTEGKKVLQQYSKIMLRAFNGECDSAIAKVSWNNLSNMEARIEKVCEAVNKLGSKLNISITNVYYVTKIEELRLQFELEEKIYQEKEEQRKIREQMREEEKVQREIQKAQVDAEAEEDRYQKALEKAKKEVEKAQGGELDKLNEKIKQLEESLKEAHSQKERAISQAQLTKSGHVYIISNIGSFGEDVYKIGMTRRLDPLDRVKELGDASVPFDFDIHGMIYSENAPELETKLHKHLENKRVNLVNSKAEFFQTKIDDIEQLIKDLKLKIQLTKLAEAREYRETISIREAQAKEVDVDKSVHKTHIEKQLDKYPSSL